MKTRAKPGDVFRADGRTGNIYVQYLGRHPEYGDAILVCPEVIHGNVDSDLGGLFSQGYVAFYPLQSGLSRGFVERVGHLRPLPLPTRYRRAGAREGRVVRTWIIEDGPHDLLRYSLSPEERALPIAEIWSHDCLIESIEGGWRPETEGEPMAAVNEEPFLGGEPFASASAPSIRSVQHYLYLPDQPAVEKAVERLGAQGLLFEARPAADGVNWLLLVRDPDEEAAIEEAGAILETLAEELGGEYDGWERALR